MNYIREYWDKIQSGEIVACKRIKQQYQKLIYDLDHPRVIKIRNSKGELEEHTFIFDEELANKPIKFIETFCKQTQNIGKPLKLELFQKAKLQAIFGFVDKDTKLRRYREALTIEGRKNGKTTEMAAVGNFLLIGDGEDGAEIYYIATKRDQARKAFTEASNMIKQSPALSKYIKKRKSDLYFPLTFSKMEPLASESNSLDGLNSHGIVIDELHAIKDRNLYDVIKQSTSSRDQPLMFEITTAGFVRECIYDDMYDYACKVLDGIDGFDDPQFLAFIYELDDRSEWTDWRMWEKANPGLGPIKKFGELEGYVERAKRDPNFLPTVLTKDFNIRETKSGSWLTFEQANNEATYDMEYLKSSYAISGTDLSATTDLSCATLLIMKPNDPVKYAIQMYFLPEDLLEKRVKEDKIPYDKWTKRGLLTLCRGNKVNYSDITQWYLMMMNKYDITPVWNYYDPWSSKYWIEEMKNYGFEMIECRQGSKTLSQPMKEMGADLEKKLINYNNNPILKWCLTNTSVERDKNDNIRPIKGQNQRQRIDGTVSLLIAYTGLFEKYNDYQALI